MLSGKHRPMPDLVEDAHRWQCKICGSWVNYSEASGQWWHDEYSDGND